VRLGVSFLVPSSVPTFLRSFLVTFLPLAICGPADGRANDNSPLRACCAFFLPAGIIGTDPIFHVFSLRFIWFFSRFSESGGHPTHFGLTTTVRPTEGRNSHSSHFSQGGARDYYAGYGREGQAENGSSCHPESESIRHRAHREHRQQPSHRIVRCVGVAPNFCHSCLSIAYLTLTVQRPVVPWWGSPAGRT
jgi:hypothetical protein